MEILSCPVCKQELKRENRIYKCENNHCFDIAKEGYVNLNSKNKSGDSTGDNKEMAAARRDFLNKGYFNSLANTVLSCANKYSKDGDNVLDICCGEGYYLDFLTKALNRRFYGFDLSKNMVRLASKRKSDATFFVANIANIPLKNNAVDFAFHLFAPFHASEFSRVLKNDAYIVTAVAGENHLYSLKEVLYNTPYKNDENPPDAGDLILVEKIKVKDTIILNSKEEINALFQMTPYYYHTPSDGKKKLEKLDTLKTDVEFVLYVYKKRK